MLSTNAAALRKMLALTLLVAVCPGAASAADPVRLGVLTDLSGPYADISGNGAVQAARMAAEDFGGAVLGRSIEILSADHLNKPDVGSAIARSWFDRDGVQAVFDLGNSAVGLAVSDAARERHRVVVGSAIGTTALTGEGCSPTTFQWTWDTYSNVNALVRYAFSPERNRWFIIAANYAMGISLESDATALVKARGGTVVGSDRPPLGTTDFSSDLLQAQASSASVVLLANGGSDLASTLKQAHEFGLFPGKVEFVAAIMNLTVAHSVGPAVAQGLVTVGPFNWTSTPGTRAFAEHLAARNNGVYPDWTQAGVYASVLHYLKGVQAAGTLDGDAVAAQMKRMPTDDVLFGKGTVRADGRAVHPVHILKVKAPDRVQSPWDLFEVVATIPGDDVLLPLSESKCALVR